MIVGEQRERERENRNSRDEYGEAGDKTFKHKTDGQAFGSFMLPRSRTGAEKGADVRAPVNLLLYNLRQVMSQAVSISNERKRRFVEKKSSL